MHQKQYEELLAKFLRGECSDEERVLLDQWYASLDTESQSVSEQEKALLLARNWDALRSRTVAQTPAQPVRFWWRPVWAAAAVVVLASGLAWYFLSQPAALNRIPNQMASGVRSLTLTKRVNTSEQPERITLSDGSVVTLQPGSQIQYPQPFSGAKREVTLVGEAFFDVQKNPQKPFFVYANDLVTKVLGTSFRVKAYPNDRDVTVAVRTGRVSVYSPKLATQTKASADPETIGVVLAPNQQVTFQGLEQRLVKTLVEKPVMLIPKAEQTSFTFQNAPVSSILTAIEKTYGIDVVYDEDILANCFITTALDQEDLYGKLTIICKLMGATYKVIDAQIVITGPGC
ncbi:FecR family protein [Spirosoma daeguense]